MEAGKTRKAMLELTTPNGKDTGTLEEYIRQMLRSSSTAVTEVLPKVICLLVDKDLISFEEIESIIPSNYKRETQLRIYWEDK